MDLHLAFAFLVVFGAVIALNATQQMDDLGTLAPAYQAGLTTTDTYTFPNDGRTFLHCKKSGAGASTMTIVTPLTTRGKAIADQTVNIPASTGDKIVGPFPPDLYNDPATGLVTISFSDITGLTVAVVRMP